MSFRKIDPPNNPWSPPQEFCKDPAHNPPTMIVLEPGEWEWTCPSCGQTQIIYVPQIIC